MKAVLIDLMDTLIEGPIKPRAALWRWLGFRNEEHAERSMNRVAHERPGMTEDEFYQQLSLFPCVAKRRISPNDLKVRWRSVLDDFVPIDGALASIKRLSKTYQTAIVSNSTPPTWYAVRKIGIDKIVNHVILSCDVGFRKPDVRIFAAALQKVGCVSGDAVMIGNKVETDVVGAIRAGIRPILFGGARECDTIILMDMSTLDTVVESTFGENHAQNT